MNKFIITAAAIAITASLGACNKAKDPTPQPTAATTTATKPAVTKPAGPKVPLTPQQVTVFHENFETAMGKIPPELREPFQKLFACEVAKNNKLPPAQQATIDGDWVVKKTAELKANPGLANCS